MTSFNAAVRRESETRNKLEKEEKRTRNYPKLYIFANLDSLNFLLVLTCPQTFIIVIKNLSTNLELSY